MRIISAISLMILVAAAPISLDAQWVTSGGNTTTSDAVGIGTTAPANELHVKDTTGPATIRIEGAPESGVRIIGDRDWKIGNNVGAVGTGKFDIYDVTAGAARLVVDTIGNIGIGTTAPASELHVVSQTATVNLRGLTVDHYTNDANAALLTARKARGTLAAPLAVQNGDNIANFFPMAYDGTQFINPGRIRFQVDGAVSAGNTPMAFQILTGANASGVERLRVTSAGDIGIGTSVPAQKLHVVGNLRVDGVVTGTNIQAQYQDLAEWVPSNADLEPGTVVILDRAVGNGVTASSGAYDTTVAGVVSAKPGIILGEEGASKEQIATTGRVRVKVDASAGSIAVVDLLVTSPKTGRAMKSSPIEVGGFGIHRPGTIIGKALEPLPSGEGEILVLLSLQ